MQRVLPGRWRLKRCPEDQNVKEDNAAQQTAGEIPNSIPREEKTGVPPHISKVPFYLVEGYGYSGSHERDRENQDERQR